MAATPVSVSAESPTTRPSAAMKVTRASISDPRRSASSSSSPTLASGTPRASRSAVILASATSVLSIRASICRRIAVAKRMPATASASSAAESAAKKNFVWNVARVRNGAGVTSGDSLDQLVAELLHGREPLGEHGKLFAKAPHVHVHRARAAGVAIAPDVGQQEVA